MTEKRIKEPNAKSLNRNDRAVLELDRIHTAYRQSLVLLTANRLRIFDSLVEEPASAEDLARRKGFDARALGILLDALTAMELLKKKGGTYRCGAIAGRHLVEGKEGYIGHRIDLNLNSLKGWTQLPEVIRQGGPARARRRKRSAREQRDFILGMADTGRTSTALMLRNVDLSGYRCMLDLGGGPGTYAITFCARYPELGAVVFDLPETISITREQIRKSNMESRIAPMEGNFFEDPIGSGYDLVLISNIIHSMSMDRICGLLRKVYEAMEPGGLVIVKDFYLDESRSSPVQSALFAVHMLVSSKGGNCYTSREIKEAMKGAGFTGIRSRRIPRYSALYMGSKKERH